MAFKKLVAPSLTELFVNELERMILSGNLHIGDKLPPERQLAEEMNVSLAVIHGGITRLTDLGFLHVVPRQGVFVADYIREGNMGTMKEIMEYSDGNLSGDLLEPITHFRRSLELLAARRACENRTEESLAILTEIAARAARTGEIANLPEICFEFHHEVAVASGNIYYPMITQTFRPLYLVFYQMTLARSQQADIVKPLQELLTALERKDADAAELLTNQSIDNWMKSFQK